MLNLLFFNDGRPRANDDLKTLQEQTQYAIFGQFLGLPACVVSGCEVRPQSGGQYDIAHGLVFIDGGIHRFDGAAAIALPVELFLDTVVESDLRPYRTGGSKPCMSERKLASRPVGGAGTALLVQPEGALRFEKAREAVLRSEGEVQWLTKVVADDYDTDGKGKYGTKAHGWQLSGAGSTADIRGRFPVAADSRKSDYAIGATGGAAAVTLGATQVPAHVHEMNDAGDHDHLFANATTNNNGTTGAGDTYAKSDGNAGGIDRNRRTAKGGSHKHVLESAGGNAAGGTDEHENRPPYLALATREWIGLF
jgi:microcystin-dependent protein